MVGKRNLQKTILSENPRAAKSRWKDEAKPEEPNAQWDRPREGNKAEHNAAMKAPQSSQVARKKDDSQMKC
jgi:hypothetical protein